MGNYVTEAVERVPGPCSFKVHHSMCTELMKLVDRISIILPRIEAARPRGSGIDALCLLTFAIDKAKLLVQDCSESSKLYMAFRGDKIVSRFQNARNTLEQSLRPIQNMVPVMLAVEISKLTDDLRGAALVLDPSEEEAGKALRELLKQGASISDSATRAFKIACSRLHIASPDSISMEKASIRKLLEKVGQKDPTKKRILMILYHLLRNYGHLIVEDKMENASPIQVDVESHIEYMQNGTEAELVSDPTVQPNSHYSWENSSSSISSLGSYMNDIGLNIDFSYMSLGSLKNSYHSGSLRPKATNWLSLMSVQSNDDPEKCKNDANIQEVDSVFPSGFSELSRESQCKIIDNYLKDNDQDFPILLVNTIEQLVRFLEDAHDHHDQRATRLGVELFLTLLSRSRNGIPNAREDMLSLLASLLDSEMIKEVLTILEALSHHRNYTCKFAASGILTSILKILDSQTKDLQERVVNFLCNLSANKDICAHIISLEGVPKLLPLLNNQPHLGNCILLLKNLSDVEEARVSITETDGCIASIARFLESSHLDEQEHAVSIFLSLCSQRVEYCELVMAEDIFPSLAIMSQNGSEKGKMSALELIRLLSIDRGDVQESRASELV